MLRRAKERAVRALRWTERYTKTDMVYFAESNFWLNISRVLSVGTGMLLTIAFANLLSPEVFGMYKYVIAAAGFVASLSLSGLGTALMRAVAQGSRAIIPSIVRTANLWSLPASAAALGVSIYYFAQGNSDLGFAFLFIAATNSFSNGLGATKGVLQAAGDFKTAMIIGIPRILVPFVIILLAILFTENVVWILFAYFSSHLLTSWIGYRWTLRRLRISATSSTDSSETVKYGTQLTGLSFFQLAGGYLDQLLLWHFTDPATLAIYAIALSPVKEASNLLNNFPAIFFPKVAVKTKAEVYATLPLRLWQMFIASGLTTLLYIVLVPFLFALLFPQYLASIVVSQVLALTLLLQPRGLIDVFFITHGEIHKRYATILGSQALKLGLFFILIPLYGLWGAVAATVVAEVGAMVFYLIAYKRSAKADAKAGE